MKPSYDDVPFDMMRNINLLVVEHCDNTCRSCSSASPFAPAAVHAPEAFFPWLDRLVDAGYPFDNLALTGGEPFLHPGVRDGSFARSLAERYPDLRISVSTNFAWAGAADADSIMASLSVFDAIGVSVYDNVVERLGGEQRFGELAERLREAAPAAWVDVGQRPEFLKWALRPQGRPVLARCVTSDCFILRPDGRLSHCSVAIGAEVVPVFAPIVAASGDAFWDLSAGVDGLAEWAARYPLELCRHCTMWHGHLEPTTFLSVDQVRAAETSWSAARSGDERAAAVLRDAGIDVTPATSLGDIADAIRWGTDRPISELARLVAEMADVAASMDFDDTLALAELVIELRATRYVGQMRELLSRHATNEWARMVISELSRLGGDVAYATDLLRADLGPLPTFDPAHQAGWLNLAARLGREAVSEVAAVLPGSPVLDEHPVDTELGGHLTAQRRADLVAAIIDHSEDAAERVRRCVDVLADRMEARAQFRSQAVRWMDFDSGNAVVVADVVDSALLAADAEFGYSAVRLGDGESLTLTGRRPDVGGVLGIDSRGEPIPLPDKEYGRVRELLASAVRSADFVGVPDLAQCAGGPRGYVDAVLSAVDAGTSLSRIMPGGCDLGWALEVGGEMRRLTARCTGIVGPVDPAGLAPFGPTRVIDWLSIPGEAIYYQDRSGSSEARSHWAVFDEICAHPFVPGQLWLVGAGILGKIYCDVIRSAGAVAIDIGSVMDVWAGHQHTRGTVRMQPWVAVPYIADARDLLLA